MGDYAQWYTREIKWNLAVTYVQLAYLIVVIYYVTWLPSHAVINYINRCRLLAIVVDKFPTSIPRFSFIVIYAICAFTKGVLIITCWLPVQVFAILPADGWQLRRTKHHHRSVCRSAQWYLRRTCTRSDLHQCSTEKKTPSAVCRQWRLSVSCLAVANLYRAS